jgi:hypothetical protein
MIGADIGGGPQLFVNSSGISTGPAIFREQLWHSWDH